MLQAHTFLFMPLLLNLNLPFLSLMELLKYMCNTIICGNGEDLNPHLKRLIFALSKVKKEYLGYETLKYKSGKIEETIKHAERVFAYELYHQYRLLMKENCGYYLSGEILKDSDLFNWEIDRNCYPDLVLHSNIGNKELSKQHFLCEIKMSDNSHLLDDLEKLAYLSKSDLKFDEYIFLCIGKTKSELKEMIAKQQIKRFLYPKTLCICRLENMIEFFRLIEIL